ncbi:MAG: hypothetical protein HKN31_07670, partial [Pricia sp.]|nr:hypothetical protein [Pricia sp.]
MAANNVLDKQVPVYHRFVDNQVLTDDQLNEVLDHINYQDKLTRTGLIGVGIVCGLQLGSTGSTIQLSQGIAVTTDGDLLKKSTTTYKGFKTFTDENVKYAHFLQGETVIPLFELEEDISPSDVSPLGQFESQTGFAKERMVALLYLESFLKEEEDCSPVDCNAQGREVAQNLRVLVTSIDMAKKIAEKDSIFNGLLTTSENDVLNKIDTYFTKRVIINSGTANSVGSLKNAYFVQFSGLFNRIIQLGEMNIFKPFTNESGFDLNLTMGKLKAHNLNFQYIYDFYKDLATAYNELLQAVHEQYSICCPNPLAFPKHVLLGEVYDSPRYLRHPFYPSPIHKNKVSLDHLQDLFRRIMRMVKHFATTSEKDIRITPSRNSNYPLGKRALPYYYNAGRIDEFSMMLNTWNVDGEGETLNYYKVGYPTPDFEPLDYCFDDHDFYRVEGHVGQNVVSVVKELQNWRTQKGLAFDIMPIAVGSAADETTLDYDKYNMYFEDLQVILQAWNEEQKCLISGSTKFLTRFSAVEKGVHLDYKAFALANFAEGAPAHSTMASSAAGLTGTTGISGITLKDKGTAALGKLFIQSKTNTVLEELDDSKDSVGGLYVKDLSESDGGSDFQVKIDKALKDTIKDWEPELQIAVAEIPSNLLGKLKVSEDNKLIDIENFTEENLAKYIEALTAQCKAAKEAKKKLQNQVSKKDSQLQSAAYIENYFFTLNRIISSCCLVERVKVLYEKILERKQELLAKMVLNEYVKSHPGVEHKAGVDKGGTFVVLYYSNEKPKKTIGEFQNIRDISIIDKNLLTKDLINLKTRTGLLGSFDLSGRTGVLKDTDVRKIIGIDDLTERFTLGEKTLDLLSATRATINLSHGTVIGDLCLPYICCTDMPATTFVYPDQEVNLFIGKDHVCVPLEGQGEQVLMEVTPVDATVNAFIEEKELNDTIIKKNGSFFFDPNKVTEDDFGKTITFKVNGQNVAEKLHVLSQPDASFTIKDQVLFRNDNTLAIVSVTNTSPIIAGQEFVWDFGQGAPLNQNAKEFTFNYEVKPGGTFTFTIKLTAENGSCSDTISQVKVITVPKLDEDPENCGQTTGRKITEGKTAIEIDLEKNPSDLKEAKLLYQREVEPIYEIIFKDISKTLEGSFDTEIYNQIEKAQKAIAERLTVNRNAKEQEFLLRLFYENMLIYFYVQACREGTI